MVFALPFIPARRNTLVPVPMTQPIPSPSQTIFVAPGQSISENLSFTAYSAIIQNNTIWYWYLDDARAYIPPGTTHFVSPLPGVSVANITFQSPLDLPQPPVPTDGSGGQLVAQFLNEQNTASPGYVGYQPMGRNRMVFELVHTAGNIPLPFFTLPVPAADGVTIYYQTTSANFGSITLGYEIPGMTSPISFSIGYPSSTGLINPNQPVHFPDAFPAGTLFLFADNNATPATPTTFWIVV